MSAQNKQQIREIHLNLPLTDQDFNTLQLGDVVFLNGLVFTGREGFYHQLFERKETPPKDIRRLGGTTFHCSPAICETAAGEYNIPSVTATASFRFAKYMPEFLSRYGIRVVIGKGGMSSKVYREAFRPNGTLYLTTIGYGLGAIYGKGIRGVKDVIWKEELGLAQAVWVLDVENFGPFMVESDAQGNSLFERSNQEINEKLLALYEGLPEPALKRLGEVTSPGNEVL